MEIVITLWSYILLGLKLTKLFCIEKIPVAKDFGKVLIIIIYCFYNYYYYCSKIHLTQALLKLV